MTKFKLINGWTKESVMAQAKKYNNDYTSVNSFTGSCSYENRDGNRCAIGCFIPDGHISLKATENVKHLLEMYPELANKMPLESKGLVKFQDVHDFLFQESHFTSINGVHKAIQNFLDNEVE